MTTPIVRGGAVALAAGFVGVLGCRAPRVLTAEEAAPPREEVAPARVAELDTRAGFGTLSDQGGEGEAEARELTVRFLNALANENPYQLNQVIGKATWASTTTRGTPLEELTRRFALFDFAALKTPLAQGSYERMQVRREGDAAWTVRLPVVPLPEPLLAGRPTLRIVREGDALVVTRYGED